MNSKDAPENDKKILRIQARLRALEAERADLQAELGKLDQRQPKLIFKDDQPSSNINIPAVTANSSTAEKVALFRRLFVGRADVFPVRWENRKTGMSGYAPACANEWAKGICGKPQVKCGECPHQAFIHVSDDVIEKHLRGAERRRSPFQDFVVGVYPLLTDETCWFLAADFDKESWAADSLAMVETCRSKGIQAALERSRSGNGGHVWMFFSEPVPARIARQLGAAIVTETMERRPEIGFSSYDRFFPSQDTMPIGGFGNLIALPLQRRARELGNSVFIDENLVPYDDQWAFLSSLRRQSLTEASNFVSSAGMRGSIFGVRLPVEDEDVDEPWFRFPSRQRKSQTIEISLPDKIRIVVSDLIYVDRTELPPNMVARLIRIAAFQNPEFYRAQSMRLQTYNKPRIISCTELHRNHVGLPRGCLDDVIEQIRATGSEVVIEDRRVLGDILPKGLRFRGQLRDGQTKAVDALLPHDYGVLAATTAFGKTVVAAAMIAQRQRNTLVLVHRRELLTQWVESLKTFLEIDPKNIGIIGGGKRKPTGIVDVALIQSLVRRGEVSNLAADYGHLIVDECHHLSAASFELVARRSKARYVLGLSATVIRKDGHHPIIFMQCGPVRHRVIARSQAAENGMLHCARIRSTAFQLPPFLAAADRPSMPAIYAALAQDEIRNDLIFDDVLKSLEARRTPIVITERRDHLEIFQKRFSRFVRNLVVLQGGMSVTERKSSEALLRASSHEERLILATGRYIGEGFDDQRLDTLFLTMPISWKGTLAQYVGRLHRQHNEKTEVIVVDYVDDAVPILRRMAEKRRAGYKSLGYSFE